MPVSIEPIAHLAIPAKDLKMLREALCKLMSGNLAFTGSNVVKDVMRIVNEIDRHRPLGSDGKHGTLHTPTCGCEDK